LQAARAKNGVISVGVEGHARLARAALTLDHNGIISGSLAVSLNYRATIALLSLFCFAAFQYEKLLLIVAVEKTTLAKSTFEKLLHIASTPEILLSLR